MKFVALDLETTGLDAENDSIIEIAAVKFENGKIIDTFQELINPGIEIPLAAQNITGITNEMVANAKSFEEVKENLKEFVGNHDILGQNIGFDIGFLAANGLKFSNKPLDTFLLARAIIPYATSYSLEVLAVQLGITQESAHRAHDDVLASVELMKKLRILLLEQSDDVLHKTKQFLKKQEWPWKNLILESIENKDDWKEDIEKAKAAKDLIITKEHGIPHKEELHKMQTIDVSGKKITEGFIDPEKYDFSEKTLVAMPGYKTYYFPKQTFSLRYNFLLPERLDTLLNKEKTWNTEEITIILKLIIWFSQTKTFNSKELKIYQKDYNIINQVSINETEEHEIYDKKLEELETHNKIYISHQNLLKIATLNLNLGIDVHNLIVLDAIEFEKSLGKYSIITLYLNDIKIKGEMLFGLLGIVFEKFKPENLKFPEIIIDDTILKSPEFQKALNLSSEIIAEDEKEGLIHPKISLLKNVIENPSKFNISLLKTREGDILFRISPKNILNVLEEKIWNKFENIIFNDDITKYKNYEFVKSALRLDKFETKPSQTPPFDFKFLTQFNASSIADQHSNIIIIFSSAGQIGQYLDEINKDQKLKKEKVILGQGASGSNGKIIMKLNPEGGNIILANFDFAMELIEIFKDLKQSDFALVFKKMPFMHPKNSYYNYISGFYLDSYDAYDKYSKPKAYCQIHKLATRYKNTFKTVEAFVLDERIKKF